MWPLDTADADLPIYWARSVAIQALGWVWKGYDVLRGNLSAIDLTQPLEQLERNLTELHFHEIQRCWARETNGFSSIQPGHELPELLSRSAPPAKPPAYDLGFVHAENRLWKFPIEAKVLPTDRSLSEYLKDVRGKFAAGIAAPIVGEGGMIGYLLRGREATVFAGVESVLGQTLNTLADFSLRPHKTTRHERNEYPALRLHHMIMSLSN